MRVIVVGLGAMGSSAAMQCALRGAHVRGIERFARGHAFGASNGKSRIIRQAYYEDAAYVPLLLRAYELWRDLEHRANERLLHLVGLLLAGREGSAILQGTLAAAREHGLNVDALDTRDVRARYPALRVEDGEVGLFEPLGGLLVPEVAVRAFAHVAEDAGAELRFETKMESWSASDDGVEVTLEDGTRLQADALVLALGPWFEAEMARAGVPMRVQRNVQLWFSPATDAYDATRFPAFLLDRQSLPAPLYGFPDLGDGVKAALHGYGAVAHPDGLDRTVDVERDVVPVARALDAWMPGASAVFREGRACMYSLTPDEHFVIDVHPQHRNVVLCGGFSGHGFKFASAVGEVVADLALAGETRHDVGFLSARRFSRERRTAIDNAGLGAFHLK
ncbi:MAG TPA: N-methyl-L-tryptophan oxidase [Candidatus Dormibacteraeota bacterium]|nr:N-methyl-L-tryptophan oxidase [Candidatus Dormibacteraeota bacterium]